MRISDWSSDVCSSDLNAFDEASDDHAMGDTLVHYLFVPRIIMQWLFPVVLTFALYLLMRGHDLPGGGFTAGIATSIAFLLLYMANGTRLVEASLSVQQIGRAHV